MTNQNGLYIENYTDEMLFDYIENNKNIDEIEFKNQPNLFSKNNDLPLSFQEQQKQVIQSTMKSLTPITSQTHHQLISLTTQPINLTTQPIKVNNLARNLAITRKQKITRPLRNLPVLSNGSSSSFSIDTSQSQNIKIQAKCKICSLTSNDDIKVIDGKIVCVNCGLVISIKFDGNMENRTFNKEDGNFSTNNGYTLVSTSMFPGYVNTNIVGTNSNNPINKLNMWNNALTADEKNIKNVYKKIREVCQKAGLTKKIEDTAKSLYLNLKKCAEEQLISESNRKKINREDKQNVMVAICILRACNINENAYNKAEIAQFCNVNTKAMTKGDKLYFEIVRESSTVEQVQLKPHELVPRLCKKLDIPDIYKNIAIQISNNIEKLYLCSNAAPQSLAATAVFILVTGYKDKLPISIDKISKCSYMAPSTIDKCYKKMMPYLAIIISNEKTQLLVDDIKELVQTMPIPNKFEEMYQRIKSKQSKQNHLH